MNKDEFLKLLDDENIYYDEEILAKLELYCNFLMEYNEHTNLTAIRDRKDIYLKHFYDSVKAFSLIDLSNVNNLLDIGTGAGFPGVIIKIFNPNINVYLLDSNNKKIKFLDELIKKLNLKNIYTVYDRAEEYAKSNLNKFDLVTSRAVAYIDIISSLSLPFINKNGRVVLMKGDFKEELQLLEKHKDNLNISSYNILDYSIINNEVRHLIILNKDKDSISYPNYSQLVKQNKIWKK